VVFPILEQQSVLVEVKNNIGWITLNRPKVLNSLNTEMVGIIYEQLLNWQVDQRVVLICITGEGTKGLCAGGDMRALYDLRDTNIQEEAFSFFSTEYQMNLLIHHYSKPILVYMDGVVMGGGVGLSIGCSHRIVTEKTKWAMPEMNIGFFPDVGSSYFLNKMPGQIGRYLALTSNIINAEDVIYTGAADYQIDTISWPKLKSDLLSNDWFASSVETELTRIVNHHSRESSTESSELADNYDRINKHFKYESIEETIVSLNNDSSDWAEKTKLTLLSKSLLSLKVTLQQLQKGKSKTIKECFDMELNLSMNFMNNFDFFEGVRSVLVDKDRTPNWKYKYLKEITNEKVASYFT